MELLTASYKKGKLRLEWLENLKTHLSLSENDITTYAEREFIKWFIDKTDEYIEEAYEPCFERDMDVIGTF